MGISTAHAIGRHEAFYVKAEVSAGTFIKPGATDAAKVIKTDFGWKPDRKPRRYKANTRSLLQRVTGKIECPWSVESEIIPSGTAGTPPDIHPLIAAILSAYTNNPGTSDVYTVAETQTIPTVTMVRNIPGIWQESLWGAWVDALTISASGGNIPTMKFEGGAMGHAQTGYSTLNGAMGGVTTMVAQTADAWNFDVNSIVKIGSDDNTGAGWKVTVASARPSFTIEGSATASNADPIVPFMPAETTAGSPLAGISGSVSWASTTIPCVGIDVSIKNNLKANTDEALLQYASDVWPGFREVSGKLTFKARRDLLIQYAKRKDVDTKKAAVITIGSTAGNRFVLSMPYCEIGFDNLEIPEAEVCMVSLPFIALGSSGNDELTASFT